jgi:hypothetical protein
MNQNFRQKIKENAPNVIMFASVCIVLLSIVACMLNGQRKDKGVGASNEPIPTVQAVQVEEPKTSSNDISVQIFVYDGNSYLLVEKVEGYNRGAIAITKK